MNNLPGPLKQQTQSSGVTVRHVPDIAAADPERTPGGIAEAEIGCAEIGSRIGLHLDAQGPGWIVLQDDSERGTLGSVEEYVHESRDEHGMKDRRVGTADGTIDDARTGGRVSENQEVERDSVEQAPRECTLFRRRSASNGFRS